MSGGRTYVSPKREAQAAATKEAILEAFAEQLSDPNRTTLSPAEAAERAGVSVRMVHNYFPDADARIIGLGEWLDRRVFPQAVRVADGPDDLARYFRDIHANALKSPIGPGIGPVPQPGVERGPPASPDRPPRRHPPIRGPNRGAERDTEEVTAMLLVLAGGDISWPMHEDYGLPIERIPDTIANTVQLIVDHLKAKTRTSG